jgi:CubicO group peptidase (beta-lactamase class C family)
MPRCRGFIFAVGFVLWAVAYCSASSADNLLLDREALQRTISEIVKPHLHRTADEAARAKDDQTGRADEDTPQAKRPSNRAWGIVVGVVTKGGRNVFGFGRFSANSDQKPDGRTLFEIGSVTKTFSALLLADLVEQGKVKLDDPVRRFLPESTTVPQRGDKEITVLHLATHTSALPRIPTSIGLKSLVSNNPYHGYGAEDLYKTLARIELSRDPGEKYEYSNLAFGLLGHVLSRQAGKSYEELVIERICKPLNLRETRIDLDDEARKRLAPPHDDLGKRSSNWDFDAFAGAGALRSTADDMLIYLEANMGWKECALLPAMRRCHEVRYPADSRVQSIGLGWHIEKVPGRPALVFHGGGTGGYNSIVGFVENDGKPLFGIVVLANAAPGGRGMVANDVAVKLLAAIRESED